MEIVVNKLVKSILSFFVSKKNMFDVEFLVYVVPYIACRNLELNWKGGNPIVFLNDWII